MTRHLTLLLAAAAATYGLLHQRARLLEAHVELDTLWLKHLLVRAERDELLARHLRREREALMERVRAEREEELNQHGPNAWRQT